MDILETTDPELERLLLSKESGYNYRERRHDGWDENYTLYRDKIITNRLTQRQSVNLPLMKQTIKTLLKDVDDLPVLYYENIDNDKQAEVFKNEYWKYVVEKNNLSLQDIVDKKQVFLYGRSFRSWQIVDGLPRMSIEDPMDMLVDRYTDPTDFNTARFLIHTNIFKPLSVLERNPKYDKQALKRLRAYYSSKEGLIKSTENNRLIQDKNKKMNDMELMDVDNPILGETYVSLSLYFVMRAEKHDEEEQFYVYTVADDMEILSKEPLEKIIGRTKDHYWRTHLSYDSWADDLEKQDFWSDGIADIVRTPNKVLNAWFSQLVENRTLRNFGMHYYDSTLEGFVPGTFNPIPWGWYGVPGKPQDVMQKVDIPDLSESLDEMQFVMQILEKATGATATQQGVQTERQITLGEVQLALGEAKERIKGMSKFYTPAWKRSGEIYLKLLEAGSNKLDAVKIYKQGKNTTNIYSREIRPKDWKTKSGYICKVWSQEEKNTRDTDSLQKLNAVKASMPLNKKLNEVYQRKLLEFADLPPEDVNAIMEEEKQKNEAMGNEGNGAINQITPPAIPQIPASQPTQ